jgi:hypothetical protein
VARKFILIFCLLSFPFGQLLRATSVPNPQFCKLFGSVYIEETNPDRADFLVFEEESEAFANIIVFYDIDNRLFANKPGLWHITDKRGFADFSVYFVDKRNQADFSVFFTDVESFAGCNN